MKYDGNNTGARHQLINASVVSAPHTLLHEVDRTLDRVCAQFNGQQNAFADKLQVWAYMHIVHT